MKHSEDQRRSAWKRDLYRRFCAELAPDQRSDAFFKIFYSDIRRSQVAIIGLNPGGNPAKPDELQRASTVYDRNEHDYVDCKYPLAVKMRNFLLRSGIAADDDGIRAIPKLNVIFHRSVSLATLGGADHAARVSAPFVKEMLCEIRPEFLLFEGAAGFATYRRFVDGVSAARPIPIGAPHVRVHVCDPNDRTIVVLSHPTGYRWRAVDWNRAMEEVGRLYANRVRRDRRRAADRSGFGDP
jgi:hypothetical protein